MTWIRQVPTIELVVIKEAAEDSQVDRVSDLRDCAELELRARGRVISAWVASPTTCLMRPPWWPLSDVERQSIADGLNDFVRARRAPVDDEDVNGSENQAFEGAMRAFHKGPPGVVRTVQNVDSYPGERVAPDDPPDPEAHQLLPTTSSDERQAIAEAINAYLAHTPTESG